MTGTVVYCSAFVLGSRNRKLGVIQAIIEILRKESTQA